MEAINLTKRDIRAARSSAPSFVETEAAEQASAKLIGRFDKAGAEAGKIIVTKKAC